MQTETAELFHSFRFFPAERQVFEKKEDLTVSQWAEKYRTVTIGAHRGPWRNDLSPHLVKIMDTWQLPHVREIVVCKSPQTGGTESSYNCAGWAMENAPDTMLFIMPSEKDARKISNDRIIPMIEQSEKLKELISPNPDDLAAGRIRLINGMIAYMAWSNSTSALATFPIKYLFFAEVDKYPPFVGNEADSITLGEKRARTFKHTHKIFKESTPTREDGPIWKALLGADVLYKFHAQCPFCQKKQTMKFSQLKWPHEEQQSAVSSQQSAEPSNPSLAPEQIHRDLLARYVCEQCNAEWTDADRDNAVRAGGWQRVKGLGLKRPRSAAFHLPSFISPDVSLSEIAAAFLRSKHDKAKLIDFSNDYLAEPFIESEDGETMKEDVLYLRRYRFTPDGAQWQVPMRGCVLTCYCDVQRNRLEAEVVAWGADHENWGIEYRQFPGDPSGEEVWQAFEVFLNQEFVHESGNKLRISIVGIDAGFKAAEVYRFVRPRQPRRVFACKGSSVRGKPLISVTRHSKLRERKKVNLIIIGTDAGKDSIFSWMNVEEPGPRYMHFPEAYGYDFFKMLTAEVRVTRYEKGRPYFTWVKKHADIRNEALDIRVGNYAMVELLNPDFKRIAEGLTPVEIKTKKEDESHKPQKPPKRPVRQSKGGWVSGWK